MDPFSLEAGDESSSSTSRTLDLAALRVHNAQQPVSRLPDDVLYTIFELTGEDSTTIALFLSRVCYFWRSAALVCKRLWTSLELSQPRLTIEFINRSRPLPMSLRFHKRDPDFTSATGLEDLVEAFRSAFQESARIEEIVFRTFDCEDIVECHFLPVLKVAKPAFPRLRRLVADFRWTPAECSKPEPEPCTEDAVDLAHFFHQDFPALRELTLDDCTVSSAFLLRCSPTSVDFGQLNVDCTDLCIFFRYAAPFLKNLRISVDRRLVTNLVAKKESIALPILGTLELSGDLALSSSVLRLVSVPPSTCVTLSTMGTLGYEIDLALTTVAKFINRQYTSGKHSLSWAVQGPYNMRMTCKSHGGLVEVTGAELDHTAFTMFCFRLDAVLRERITLLRVRDHLGDSTSASQSMAAPQWLALANVLRHVRNMYISGGAASSFLRTSIIPLDGDAVFFPDVATLHLFEVHSEDASHLSGEWEMFAKYLHDTLVAISERQTSLQLINIDRSEALPMHLRTLAMRASIALYHRGECVTLKPSLVDAKSAIRVWSPPERLCHDFELNDFDSNLSVSHEPITHIIPS
jgi:hypothetical protein